MTDSQAEKQPSQSKNPRRMVLVQAHSENVAHLLSKRAERNAAPKSSTRTPDFIVNSKEYHLTGEKEPIWLETIYGQGNWDHKTEGQVSSPKQLTLPELPEKSKYDAPYQLQENEILTMLKEVAVHTAYGPDRLAYQALKICRVTIAPIITHIFNKFLLLNIHPADFKKSILVAIRKPNKPAHDPKAYRPIALLNCLGKLFERIVANRLKAIILEHNVLPKVQFGTPGNSTTHALEYLTNKVIGNWLRNRKVSLFGLDLTGAYDHVKRQLLLKKMVEKGFPNWIIKFLWSYLSNRYTVVRLPREEMSGQNEYWIHEGVPQGGPLSSILFLIYADCLLENPGVSSNQFEVSLFAFVDDTYVIVMAREKCDREEMCKIFKEVHDRLVKTADSHHFKFSPTKYNVFHFVKPGSRSPDDQALPKLKEFDNLTQKEKNDIRPDTLKILGVIFDKRLTFIPHIEQVRRKSSCL